VTFPTRFKSKISTKLSYPLGAELISSELAGVPQAGDLEVTFSAKYETMQTRGKPYAIFQVQYAGERRRSFPCVSIRPDPAWTIRVHPVPRGLKHAVQESLVREMFPHVREWLERHAGLNDRYGLHRLSVLLDETSETLLKLQEFHLREAS
jgi:hypothetical protein